MTKYPQEAENNYWPSMEWRTSTPEEQGMSSEVLTKMVHTIINDNTEIHSILIIRNGFMVTEAYFHPYTKDTKHVVQSVQKSFISTLVGIAIEEGHIENADSKMLGFFTDSYINITDPKAENITVKHLLTMSAGNEEGTKLTEVQKSNCVKAFLEQSFPMKQGVEFVYDSIAPYVLLAAIKKSTCQSTLEYLSEKLFRPIGLTDITYIPGIESIGIDFVGIMLKPADMARFGYLFLKNGIWEGKRLVPSEWNKEATKKQISGEAIDDYGYYWWINSFGGYRADGYGGQYIIVLPEQDIVVVFTSSIDYSEVRPPLALVKEYILSSVKSNAALPSNPEALAALSEILKEVSNPKPSSIAEFPPIAEVVSGKLFIIEDNSFGIQKITLHFSNNSFCTLLLSQNDKEFTFQVGLDGVCRTAQACNVGRLCQYHAYEQVALKGTWENYETFKIEWRYIGEHYKDIYTFSFSEKEVRIEIRSTIPHHLGISDISILSAKAYEG